MKPIEQARAAQQKFKAECDDDTLLCGATISQAQALALAWKMYHAIDGVVEEIENLRAECDRLRRYYHEVAETCCEMRSELERLMDIVCEEDRRIIEQILGLESEVDED